MPRAQWVRCTSAQESSRAQCMRLHACWMCWIRIGIGQCASDAPQYRQPCAVYVRQNSGPVFMSAVVAQNMRRHSLLRWYDDHSHMSCVWTAYTPRKLGAVGISTAHLPHCYCIWYARRSHSDFFNMFKFDGIRSARGVCLAHLGDSPAYVWRSHSVCEDPRAHVAYLPHSCYFCRSIAGQWNRGIRFWSVGYCRIHKQRKNILFH